MEVTEGHCCLELLLDCRVIESERAGRITV